MLGPHTESRMQGSGAQTQHPVLLGDADQSPGVRRGLEAKEYVTISCRLREPINEAHLLE